MGAIFSDNPAFSNGLLMLLIALVATTLMMVSLRRRQGRQQTARDLTREHLARLRDQTRVRNSMDELLVQLEETARRITAQIDTRFAKLEVLNRHADERIARLEALESGGAPADGDNAPEVRETPADAEVAARKAVSREALLPKLGFDAAQIACVADREQQNPPDSAKEQQAGAGVDVAVDAAREAGHSDPSVVAPQRDSQPPTETPPPREAKPRRPIASLSPLHQRVLAALDAGTPAIRVAEAEKMTLGEVELIRELREMNGA